MKKELKKSLIFNIGLLFLMLIVGYASFETVQQTMSLRKESRDTDKQIQDLTAKKKELEARLEELKTAEATEKTAKERLNLKKIGENVVVVVPEGNKNQSGSSTTIWMKIKKFFQNLGHK